ncbi:MAG: aldehyde dehydrogenase family protein, partial [Planctomycetota bacterium]
PGRLGRYIGEMNETARRPRGVVAVITPWNFPLAIPALFIAPALAAGNTVVFKPASATRPIARMFYDILQQSMQEIAAEGRDIPAHRETVHVLNFVPGPGSVVGPAIVQDPRVSTVAFAGSRAVAEAINEGASIVADGSTYHYKNLLCYTGGHNAVIVDASADLGEAVTAVRNCAFGFAGQQATACRRVLVHTSAFDAFLDKLCESTAEMKIGDPRIPGTLMGPMISEEAQRTVLEQVEAIKSDTNYTPVLAADLPPADQLATGWSYVAPQILMERLGNRATNSKANAGANSTNFYPGTNGGNGTLATLAPTTAASADGMLVADPLDDWEIFGPVLGVVEVADFAEGLAIANRSGYRLTGGVFSRKPSNINLARTGFRVGSLYINNPITHGRVGRQPLGGLGLAGHGLECGGPQFLDHFVSPATVIENTMRRGFAPDL